MLAERDLISGYLLSHPWKRYDPPPLDSIIEILPPSQDSYYIHDLALAASARGHGMAAQIIEKIIHLAHSRKLASVSLGAVGNSKDFWRHQKFEITSREDLDKKLETYGTQAHYMETAQRGTNGITFTGASATISPIDQTLTDRIGVPVTVADQSNSCVAKGLHHSLVH